MADSVDRTFDFGVDVACFAILHPKDFSDRDWEPPSWIVEEPMDEAMEAGLLFGVMTGGDGIYRIRITDGKLAPDERDKTRKRYPFRLDVRHGWLFVGDPYHDLPPPDDWHFACVEEDDSEANCWVKLRNGRYRATLHVLERDESDRDLADFVLTLEPAARFDEIPVYREFPHLYRDEGAPDDGREAPEKRKPERRASHPKFGPGIVLSEEPSDRGPRCRIRFDDGSEKVLLASFLQMID